MSEAEKWPRLQPVGFRGCKNQTPLAEACATIAAPAYRGAAREPLFPAPAEEPGAAAERESAPLVAAPHRRWPVEYPARVQLSESAATHSPQELPWLMEPLEKAAARERDSEGPAPAWSKELSLEEWRLPFEAER
jgi:hypothetical protein